jgi:hypothetical protein
VNSLREYVSLIKKTRISCFPSIAFIRFVNIKNQNKESSLFKDKHEDWWNGLPTYVRQDVNESVKQANSDEFISFDEVKKEVSALLKK